MAAARKGLIEFPNRRQQGITKSEIQVHDSLMLDKKLLAQKSGKIARQVEKNPEYELPRLLRDISADAESMDLLARFCHGYEINLSAENVIRVACLAKSLDMTESHCPHNLLNKALSFFENEIIHSWNNSIIAVKSAAPVSVLRQAEVLGLMDLCAETLILKALEDPRLLGEPLVKKNHQEDGDSDYDNNLNYYVKPNTNTRRKLFDMDWKSQDLTSLELKLYAPIINAMIRRQVRSEFVAANLWQYAKNWILDDLAVEKMNGEREIIEVLARLIPQERGVIPCTFLCEMLRFAIGVEANAECRNALELRIGMQLEEADTKDLLMPCHGYASGEKYDTGCLKRIVSHFYSNYEGDNLGALRWVADLLDEFLGEIAADIDLKTTTFLAVAELSGAAAEGANRRSCDGMYRAVDVFLEKHGHLTESEKEDLCGRVLDCSRLSGEALQHAALNERLPLRVVVQALFASQLKLREEIPKAMIIAQGEGEGEEEEMEKMGSKVSKLERECLVMRREMAKGRAKQHLHKFSVWREMKRKFGCITTRHDCDCHVKKKKLHPR